MGETVRRILLIGVARIGDTLLLTPAMRALKERFPASTLTVLAHPKRREVLDALPFVDRCDGITKLRSRWLGWQPGRAYDLAFVYGKDVELVRYALRVARRVFAFDESEFAALKTPRLQRVRRPHGGHAQNERLALVEAAGVVADDRRLAYRVLPQEKTAALALLAANEVRGRPRIGLQTFSFPTKAHRDWPLDHFAGLIEAIAAVHADASFVVLGDAQAAQLAQPLAQRFPGRVHILAGQTALRESAALMSCLDLYVGVDTGPTHIAGALGIPMVAMYHYLYPGANLAPLQNPQCSVVEHPATGQAVDATTPGMTAIPVAAIAERALARLAAAAPFSEASDGDVRHSRLP